MARKTKRSDTDANYWDQLTIMIPYHFPAAAREAAHRYGMPVTEWARQALLLRLAADGVHLDDYRDVAA
jgi:hypothetical protein